MTHRISIRRAALLTISLLVSVLAFAPLPQAGAAFPGPNGRIAFNDFFTGQIYSVNPDGSALVQLTDLPRPAVAFDQVWSADSEQLVFATNETGDFEVYVMDADGSNETRVTHAGRSDDVWTSWFPSGRRVIFSRCLFADPTCAIFTVRVDGTHESQLTPFRHDVFDVASAVSPDGSMIAFSRIQGRGVIGQVIVMDADGTGAHHVTPARLEALAPDWSPDGERLIYHNACCKPHSSIFVSDSDGSDRSRITHPPYPQNDIFPVFAPEGDRIAFSSDRTYEDFCCSDLFVAGVDGRHKERITPRGGGAFEPDWGSAPIVAGGATIGSLPALERAAQRAGRPPLDPRACHGLVQLTFLAGGCPLHR